MRKKYISDHDVFDFDVSVNKPELMHVGDTMEKLSQDFDDLFFLEDFEIVFEAK